MRYQLSTSPIGARPNPVPNRAKPCQTMPIRATQMAEPCPGEAHLDTAPSRRLDLPLLLWRRGLGRGSRHAWTPMLPVSAIEFVPLSPRYAGGEREIRPGAVSRCARQIARTSDVAPEHAAGRPTSSPRPNHGPVFTLSGRRRRP